MDGIGNAHTNRLHEKNIRHFYLKSHENHLEDKEEYEKIILKGKLMYVVMISGGSS